MTDVWSERGEAYRQSEAHREGADLDQLVTWALKASGREALDVATGGKHVTRRLVGAGFLVVSSDSAAGMQPDVICRAEDLPFASGSFDVVACRVAPHHFGDVGAAVAEMARVSRELVIVVDNEFMDDEAEQAEVLRDPTHVRNYSEAEWREFFDAADLVVDDLRRFAKQIELDAWLARTGCTGAEELRVRELLADHIDANTLTLSRVGLVGRKAG